uniref:cytoplasmic dynein 2 intermediate chain 2 n=1 Tax=Myxine glutinosa TaxID=7769 RepID=UPI00358FF9B6
MFSDSSSTQIDVTSYWHEAKPSREVGTQAGPTGAQHVAAQTASNAEAASQAGGPECELGCVHVEGDDLDVSSELLGAEVDEPGLLGFLRRVEVPMCRELQKAASSRAFARIMDSKLSSMKQGDLQLLHTLRFRMAEQQGLAITGLGWSASGSVIAVAFGQYSRETTQTRSLIPSVDNSGWEAKPSFLCTWNLHRPRMDPDSPDLTLEAPGSLTCLACHPEKSAIIAAGAYNGDVFVWETNRDGDMLAGQSCGQSYGHEEPIHQMSWVREGGSASQSWLLITAGTDGRVLLWRFTTRGLELQRGLVLLRRDLPGAKSSKIRGDLPVGITALSFFAEDPTMFVAGTEGGHVLKCSLKGGPPVLAPGLPSSVLLRGPALLAYDPLCGPVYAAHCSPFHRNIALCAGADPDLRVYSLLQPRPLRRLPCPSYVFSAAWSPVRPLLCAAATAQGDLVFFNIVSQSTMPVLHVRGCTEGLALYQLLWSPGDGRLLVTGGAAGRVSVWNLLGSLAESGGRAAMAELDHLAAESN